MKFIQAKNYKKVGSRTINGIVIHTMEAPEKGSTAESIANYFAAGKVVASAHYCIDNDSEVQCVRDGDVAYHAPGANSTFLGFEHAGYARQSPAEWQDAYSQSLLKRSAGLAALKCIQFNIPVVWLSAADLKAGKRGITSHVIVNQAFHKSTHTDPGPNFPVEQYLGYVRDGINYFNALNGEKSPVSNTKNTTPSAFFSFCHPTLRKGDKNGFVNHLQEILGVKVDGDFGVETHNKVVDLQKFLKLPTNGVVDHGVWALLHGSIKKGDAGPKVVELQKSLNLNDDGKFGPNTEEAVNALQASKKLPVTGEVNPHTWLALFIN